MGLNLDARSETLALVSLLGATSPGVLLTFRQLSAAAGLDVRAHRHLLQSAFRVAEREHGVVYRNERDRGYRRLTTEEMPHVEARAADHQRNVARQTIQTLNRGVERVNDIPKETQARLDQALVRQGVIARLTRRDMLKADSDPDSKAPLPSHAEIAQRLLDRVPLRRRKKL